jgi:hypothetical protein
MPRRLNAASISAKTSGATARPDGVTSKPCTPAPSVG